MRANMEILNSTLLPEELSAVIDMVTKSGKDKAGVC